jgi:signal transduction histidine kinase/ActR/RegA family two-component response regulator
VLATPVWIDGKVVCAVEIYSSHMRHWSAEEFRIAEWIAAQVALALQALDYQADLEQRRRDAEQASIQKTQFLAAVSHDVRTPANAISLLADVIEQSADDPKFAPDLPRTVGELRSNARALVELVSDVLDLARLDAGKLELQTSVFSLNSLVETEVRQHLPVARAKGIALEADLPPKAPWVLSDKMKLARVLSNIIGNAVKFTDIGQVRVGVAQRSGGGLEISISDTGVGIAHEQIQRIFDEFYQIQNPERDRNKGTGLGLAICKRLADRLGCAITVESAPGNGSTFRIGIPAEAVTTAPVDAMPVRAGPNARARLSGVRVLLVEDHDGTRRAAAQLLSVHGASVFQAANGRTAIHMLAHEHPEVLLLDLMLPDMDGSEVLRQLQYHRPDSLRCVLAVSGDVRPERESEVRRLGGDGLVAKPLNIDDLLASINAHIGASGPPQPPVMVQPPAADPIEQPDEQRRAAG